MNSKKPILLIEDDEVDVMTVKSSLEEIKVVNRLDVASNGEEALKHLRSDKNELPCLILLDLNMPLMNGIEFLEVFKNDYNLKRIPVVVLTTSKEEQDKIDSYNLGVAGYMVKPVEYIEFVEAMKTIDLYWTLSKLPE
jgi:CheY-like chemotaxis protein